MRSAHLFKNTASYCFALIAIGFFMTSLGWLAWLYHLMQIAPDAPIDAITMIAGYLCQAVGVGIFACARARAVRFIGKKALVGALGCYAVCSTLAATCSSLAACIAFGLAMGPFCGIIAGHYLDQLANHAREDRRAIAFGGGYCIASILQWAVAQLVGGALPHALGVIAIHIICMIAFAYLVLWETPASQPSGKPRPAEASASTSEPGDQSSPCRPNSRLPENLLPLACTTVILLSFVKNLGFGFPTADLASGVDLESSRLFYALGLLLAGFITDRHRQYGAICCLAACATPFIMLALSGNSVSATVLWCLDYFFYGFFAVFRVVLFVDIAAQTGRLWLAGFGLALGRLGDAIGTAANLLLGEGLAVLIMLSALAFVLTVFLFFRLMQCLYIPDPAPQRTAQERFEAFAISHGLSLREREVLRLALDEKSNSEIAAQMFISESTAKFHIRNILKKTGCKNRIELLSLYAHEDASA